MVRGKKADEAYTHASIVFRGRVQVLVVGTVLWNV